MRRFFEGAVHASMVAQACFLDPFRAFLYPRPGILLVFADIFFEHDADEELHRLKASLIDVFRGREHGGEFHVQGPKALVAVANGGVDKTDFVAHLASGKMIVQRFKRSSPHGSRAPLDFKRASLVRLTSDICINSCVIDQTAKEQSREKLSQRALVQYADSDCVRQHYGPGTGMYSRERHQRRD